MGEGRKQSVLVLTSAKQIEQSWTLTCAQSGHPSYTFPVTPHKLHFVALIPNFQHDLSDISPEVHVAILHTMVAPKTVLHTSNTLLHSQPPAMFCIYCVSTWPTHTTTWVKWNCIGEAHAGTVVFVTHALHHPRTAPVRRGRVARRDDLHGAVYRGRDLLLCRVLHGAVRRGRVLGGVHRGGRARCRREGSTRGAGRGGARWVRTSDAHPTPLAANDLRVVVAGTNARCHSVVSGAVPTFNLHTRCFFLRGCPWMRQWLGTSFFGQWHRGCALGSEMLLCENFCFQWYFSATFSAGVSCVATWSDSLKSSLPLELFVYNTCRHCCCVFFVVVLMLVFCVSLCRLCTTKLAGWLCLFSVSQPLWLVLCAMRCAVLSLLMTRRRKGWRVRMKTLSKKNPLSLRQNTPQWVLRDFGKKARSSLSFPSFTRENDIWWRFFFIQMSKPFVVSKIGSDNWQKQTSCGLECCFLLKLLFCSNFCCSFSKLDFSATDSGSDTDPQQPLLPGAEGIAVETLPLEALSQEVLPEDGIGEAVASDAHAKHDWGARLFLEKCIPRAGRVECQSVITGVLCSAENCLSWDSIFINIVEVSFRCKANFLMDLCSQLDFPGVVSVFWLFSVRIFWWIVASWKLLPQRVIHTF